MKEKIEARIVELEQFMRDNPPHGLPGDEIGKAMRDCTRSELFFLRGLLKEVLTFTGK